MTSEGQDLCSRDCRCGGLGMMKVCHDTGPCAQWMARETHVIPGQLGGGTGNAVEDLMKSMAGANLMAIAMVQAAGGQVRMSMEAFIECPDPAEWEVRVSVELPSEEIVFQLFRIGSSNKEERPHLA